MRSFNHFIPDLTIDHERDRDREPGPLRAQACARGLLLPLGLRTRTQH